MLSFRLKPTLRLLWLLVVSYGELGVFTHTLSSCVWPHVDGTLVKHMLVVADPQILDLQSYPDRSAWLQWVSQAMTDLNMRKSGWAVWRKLRPDVVVFLGDMMDRGRIGMPQPEYDEYVARFRSIFSSTPTKTTYFLPGNHDIGLGGYGSPLATHRYKSSFGPLNQVVSVANHTLLLLDASKLVDEDTERTRLSKSIEEWKWHEGETFDYVSRIVPTVDRSQPLILFTHIPLHRPEGSPCGPLRERGTIRRGRGPGYQNTLGREISARLIQSLQPALIMSGDDHDYCDYTHNEGHGQSVREVTVKSFSMAMSVRRPGFHLLTLSNHARADTPCLLPDQISIYLSLYVPLLLLSLLAIIFANFRRAQRNHKLHESGDNKWEGVLLPMYELAPRPSSPSLVAQRARGFSVSKGGASWLHRRGFVSGFVSDVCLVAWPPLSLFGLLTLWAFW